MNKIRLLSLLVMPVVAGCDWSGQREGATADPGSAAAAAAAEPGTTTRTPAPPSTAGSTSAPAATRAATEGAAHSKLYGTWVAREVDASMGDVKVELTFREDGPVRILAWSDLPLVGQVRNKKAPYEVHGNTISSDAIRGGTSVNYRFDGGDLLIEYKEGKTVRFNRKS